MSFEHVKFVWRDGKILPWDEASVHVSAHALHYGTGVFEGIRCYETRSGSVVFRLREHLERFEASAAAYNIKIPYSVDQLSSAVCELIRKNEFPSCYIRPIGYVGSGSLGLHPGKSPIETAILVWPWGAYLGSDGLEKGISVTISRWRKFHSSMMPTRAKACGQYLNSILAVRDAFARGFDEALLLDKDGRLAEGSGENLFIVRNGAIYTNGADDSILMGITRDAVITIARDSGFEVRTRSLGLDDLFSADEAFFTGTAAEITPIRAVDERPIGSGRRGPVTTKIQRQFFDIVGGRDERYAKWLHPVASAVAV